MHRAIQHALRGGYGGASHKAGRRRGGSGYGGNGEVGDVIHIGLEEVFL